MKRVRANAAIVAQDRDALRQYSRLLMILFGSRGKPAVDIVMTCCGATRRYWRECDIPENDVGPCACGNWFIVYEETKL